MPTLGGDLLFTRGPTFLILQELHASAEQNGHSLEEEEELSLDFGDPFSEGLEPDVESGLLSLLPEGFFVSFFGDFL